MDSLARHPSGCLPGAKVCCETKARRAHGEVADEIPRQRGKLDQGREKGQDSAMKLGTVSMAGGPLLRRGQLTLSAKTSVSRIEPKYAAVNGSLCAESRW